MNVQNKLYSTDAECAVLGGLLLNNDSFDDVVAIIKPSDFYLTAHQYIFKGISALIEAGKPADILTVEQYFKEQGILQELGGMSYLAEKGRSYTEETINSLQYEFQALGLHKKKIIGNDSTNFWKCRVIGPRKNSFLVGYLVPNPKLFFGDKILINNRHLSLEE